MPNRDLNKLKKDTMGKLEAIAEKLGFSHRNEYGIEGGRIDRVWTIASEPLMRTHSKM